MNLSRRMLIGACLVLLALTGCAHYPVNAPLQKYDPDYGYKAKNVRDPEKPDNVLLLLTFSGGGTRAAAFSYGVLEALRDTEVTVKGKKNRMVDEVDGISGVSGGSFTAAYYGLFGDRIFEDFERKFLKENIQGGFGSRIIFNPYNWVRLFSPYFDRSEVAAEYYDKYIFEGATFNDMMKRKGPMILINATDMIYGARLAFTQDAFDILCSDLSTFSVARACAASSAVPLLLTPVTVKSYAGTCGYTMPKALEEALKARNLPNRQFDLANNLLPFLDAQETPYIHLVDGGVADNLGVRALLEKVIATGDAYTSLKNAGEESVHKIVFVVVNAETQIDPKVSLLGSVPGFGAMLDSYSSIAIERYNIETIALLRESFSRWADEIRKGRCPPGQISKEPGACGDVEFYLVEVKFDALRDEAERTYFKRLPTSFKLEPDQVDKLRDAAHRILTESREFQRLLKDLQ
jgi:NTE family protein